MLRRNAYQLLMLAAIASGSSFAGDRDSIQFTVENGAASFVADTNVPAVSIKGKSTALRAQVMARRDAEGIHIEKIEATLPIKSLQTGMGLRDDHMRKYVFTTPDGNTPDLLFHAEDVTCPAGAQTTCAVKGNLTIRGVARAFAMPLKVREVSDGFKATGESTVKLSDYGIEQPKQFGVRTQNEVKIHLDFSARSVQRMSFVGGSR
jgi:polyisoprenoid-binding protein YceI